MKNFRHVLTNEDKLPYEMKTTASQVNHSVLVGSVEAQATYQDNDILNNEYFDKLVDSIAVKDND